MPSAFLKARMLKKDYPVLLWVFFFFLSVNMDNKEVTVRSSWGHLDSCKCWWYFDLCSMMWAF